jgi:nucleoid DNA-binding protein
MKSLTKPELVSQIETKDGALDKRTVLAVLDALRDIVYEQLKTNGVVTIPGVVILTAIHKEATPEHPGINPFTKQAVTVKAKPASIKIKCKPVKALKDAL